MLCVFMMEYCAVNSYENPVSFEVCKKTGDMEITYSDMREICQGGPEIGTISINGRQVAHHRFGGPFLTKDEFVYAPVFVKRSLGFGFRMAKINLKTLEAEFFGKNEDLIFIERIEGNTLYYFKDLNKKVRHQWQIE